MGVPRAESATGPVQRAARVRVRSPVTTELQVTMRLILHIWRQKSPSAPGKMVRYDMNNADHEMSVLEMLDVLNEDLLAKGEEPVAFEHDCREGICGSRGVLGNGGAPRA